MQAQTRAEGVPAQFSAADGSVARFMRPTGRFLAHFAEMCMVMCLVGAFLMSLLVFGGASLLGFGNALKRFPELSTALIAFNLSLSMLVWMLFRGMGWRPTLEMTGATIAVGVLLIVGLWSGLVPIPKSGLSGLIGLQCGVSCVVMLPVMLFRLDLNARNAGHHGHAHAT